MTSSIVLAVCLSTVNPCDDGVCKVTVTAIVSSPAKVTARIVTAKPARKALGFVASRKPARRVVLRVAKPFDNKPVRRVLFGRCCCK